MYRHTVIDLDALRQIAVAHAVELEPATKTVIARFNDSNDSARVVLYDYSGYNEYRKTTPAPGG